MVEFLKGWIMNIAALVLFIVLVEMLLPSGRMKKYAGLVTGVILIIAIINPFIKLLGDKAKLEDIQVSNSNWMDRLEIEKNSKLLKDEQMKQITEVYRKKLIGQLEDNALKIKGVAGAKADVIINEDYNSDSFGEIKRAYLEITPAAENGDIKPVTRVERIKIGEGSVQNESGTPLDPALKKQLEDRIGSLFGLNSESIVISHE